LNKDTLVKTQQILRLTTGPCSGALLLGEEYKFRIFSIKFNSKPFSDFFEFIADFRKKFGYKAKLHCSRVFMPDLHFFLGYFVMLELLNTIEILSLKRILSHLSRLILSEGKWL